MKWKPIEKAPKDGTRILVWDGENAFVAGMAEGSDGRLYWEICRDYNAEHAIAARLPLTHWMPLPEPPDA